MGLIRHEGDIARQHEKGSRDRGLVVGLLDLHAVPYVEAAQNCHGGSFSSGLIRLVGAIHMVPDDVPPFCGQGPSYPGRATPDRA